MGSSKPNSKKPNSTQLDLANARIRQLEFELQTVRLEFAEEKQVFDRVMQDFNVFRAKVESSNSDELDRRMEKLFLDISSSVAQLLTQDHLLSRSGKPVQAKDVLNVSNSLIKTLTRNGLETVGTVGEDVSFDINVHEPINQDEAISGDELVTVRMVGIAYKGKVLRRASVSKNHATSTEVQ